MPDAPASARNRRHRRATAQGGYRRLACAVTWARPGRLAMLVRLNRDFRRGNLLSVIHLLLTASREVK